MNTNPSKAKADVDVDVDENVILTKREFESLIHALRHILSLAPSQGSRLGCTLNARDLDILREAESALDSDGEDAR